MRISLGSLIILFSLLLPGPAPAVSGATPSNPELYSRGLIYLPGTHNNWDLDADNLVPEKTNLGGAISFYGKTISVSVDDEFKIVDGDWTHNWGAGYWITDYNSRWTIGFDGTNAIWKGTPGTYLHVTIQQPEDYYGSPIPVGIMSLSAMPVSLDQVTQVGDLSGGTYFAPGEQTVDCTLSGSPSPEEIVYLRYTSDSWSTSNFVEMNGSGTTYSGNIPVFDVGTEIIYYVLSTTIPFSAGNDLDNYPDLMTISYNTNSGNNFNYTVCADSDGDGICNDLDPEPDCITNDTDDCGVCSGNNSDMDCTGECFGNAIYDCANVCDGNALTDDCGICAGGNTGLTPNADMDCAGECFGNAVVDCNGDCDGTATIDNCGICAGGATGLEPNADDLGCGCFQPAPQPWCSDEDQDGLGDPASQTDYCTGNVPDGWVENCTDTSPNGGFFLEYGSIDISEYPSGSLQIMFSSSFSVSVLLFDVGGLTLTGADLAPGIPNMDIGASGSTVTIYSPAGTDYLQPGSGLLATVYFQYNYEDGAESCLSIQDIFDDLGNTPDTAFGDCITLTLPPADCAGVPNGPNLTDDCGICDDSPENDNEAQDCTGLCFGTAIVDDCGVCSGGDTGLTPNADMDCAGVCYGDAIEDCAGDCNGPAVLDPNNVCCQPDDLDLCGVCNGLNLDMDCNGDCFGTAIIDDCYYCVEGNSGYDFNFMMDDCGVCGGNNQDMDCTGTCFGDAQEDCLGECGGTATEDCNGDCNGGAVVDECGICCGGETGFECSYWISMYDFGGAYDCGGNCFGDYVIDDCFDCILPGFPPENLDCAGVCYGSALVDDCGICAGGTTGLIPNADMDCTGECFGTAIENECGCVGGSTGLEPDFCYGCGDTEACNYDPDVFIDDLSCYYPHDPFDCDGNCLYELDSLGNCCYSEELNECGICYFDAVIDCYGECNGEAIENECGCVGGSTGLDIDFCYGCGDTEACNYNPEASIDDGSCEYPSEFYDCDGNCIVEVDCLGVCGGTAELDWMSDCCDPEGWNECGLCYGEAIMDCAGVCYGEAIEDDCGICAGGTTGLEINADMDCNGECFGEAIENECGCVGGSTDLSEDYCYGCTDENANNWDPIYTVDDGSCSYDSIIPGDITLDGVVDVVDVVFMVNVILEETVLPEDQMTAGDLYQDGTITILDLVWLINLILGGDLASQHQVPMIAESLWISDSEISLDHPDGVAAIQVDYVGTFLNIENNLPDGWQIRKNQSRIIFFSMDGSSLTESTLLRFTGDITILSAFVADRAYHERQLSVNSIPAKESLVEVYPNPFNPDVSIRYYLEESYPVRLRIYDVSGRLVEELSPQENLRSPGWHQVRWSGADLPGGIYILKFRLPEGMISQKLVLLK